MIQLRPKSQFQSHENIKKELATVVASDNFQFALAFALAEYVTNSTPSAEQLVAVRSFISVLVNLPLQEDPPRTLPVRTLDYSQLETQRPR